MRPDRGAFAGPLRCSPRRVPILGVRQVVLRAAPPPPAPTIRNTVMRKAIFVFIATLAGGVVVADFADAQGC